MIFFQPNHTMPVMFWIYGGGFTQGNTSFYGPDFLMHEGGVIVVSANYRLAVLGFISTGDQALPGNLGLKDQNLALKWTKRNIKYFGGDPHNITIFGQSAGGTSVGLHLVSKRSTGEDKIEFFHTEPLINKFYFRIIQSSDS